MLTAADSPTSQLTVHGDVGLAKVFLLFCCLLIFFVGWGGGEAAGVRDHEEFYVAIVLSNMQCHIHSLFLTLLYYYSTLTLSITKQNHIYTKQRMQEVQVNKNH